MQLIAAVSRDWGLGNGGRLLFSIPDDLARFKKLTWGGTVVMGRKTLDSLPGGRPLPGRENLVLTRNAGFSRPDVRVCADVNAVLQLLPTLPQPVSVIGGGEIYRQLLDECDTVYLTWVNASPEADVWFPPLAEEAWQLTWQSPMQETDGCAYQYRTYERRGTPCSKK